MQSVLNLFGYVFSAILGLSNLASAESDQVNLIEPINIENLDDIGENSIAESVVVSESRNIETAVNENVFIGDPLEIVVYSSFDCIFCRDLYWSFKKIQENYNIKIFYNNVLLDDILPIKAFKCSEKQGKSEDMHDLIFSNISELNPERMEIYAQTLELNIEEFKNCLNDESWNSILLQEKEELINNEITVVPTTILDGEKIEGDIPVENLEWIIRKKLKALN